ncbi:MAG: hypothetical protein IH973_09630 [Myxococcales bacterium]|nr:hypothetical protein [Myxococcales bacterium]
MTVDELAQTILEEVVEQQEEEYDEASKDRPFGMAAMIEEDKPLWLDE